MVRVAGAALPRYMRGVRGAALPEYAAAIPDYMLAAMLAECTRVVKHQRVMSPYPFWLQTFRSTFPPQQSAFLLTSCKMALRRFNAGGKKQKELTARHFKPPSG